MTTTSNLKTSQFAFLLSKKDARGLAFLAKRLDRTKADVLRLLIRERLRLEKRWPEFHKLDEATNALSEIKGKEVVK